MRPTITRGIRLISVLAAAGLGGAAAVAAQVGAASGAGSPGALAAAAVAGLGAVGCLAVAVAPTKLLQRLCDYGKPVIQRLAGLPVAISSAAAISIVAAGFLSFALIVGHVLNVPQDPWDDDQGAFLTTAQEIHELGGPRWLWNALWSGEFSEDNRHPLYLALLSVRPTLQWGMYLSAAIGAVTLLALVSVLSRCSGRLAAGIFCALLATNGAFCLFSARVVCDVLLVFFCGLAWLIHVPPVSTSRASRQSPLRCAAGGGLLALAWLTKGTGLVLFLSYLMWIGLAALWPGRSDLASGVPAGADSGKRMKVAGLSLICALAAFLAVGSPLLARNVARFGNPFHNLNSLLLFADRYEDLSEMLDRRVTTGAAAREYLATHSIGDIARREATGLIWEAYIIVRSLGPAPLDDARVLFGAPLMLLAMLRMVARQSAADGLLCVWAAVCWAMFAWYVPIAAGERFILPLLAPVLILASESLARMMGQRNNPLIRWLPGLAAGWCALWVLASWMASSWSDRTG